MAKIKTKNVYFSHTVALTSLFIAGQFIITLPFIKDLNSIFGVVVSAVLGVLFCVLFLRFCDKIFRSKFILIAVAVFSAFVLAETFMVFCDFVSSVLYENFILAVILFSVVCIYFGLKNGEDIFKFSLLAFIYSVIVLSVFIFLLLPNLKYQNISIPENFGFPRIYGFWDMFFPVILVSVLNVSVEEKISKGAIITGVIIGAAILFGCALVSVLLFGSEFSAEIEFPFLKAVSTVAIGKLFSRMDAFIYPVFLFCSLLRVSVCVFVIKFCLKKQKVKV